MSDAYQPKYQWKRTEFGDGDTPTDLDWVGGDGTAYIGRIRKEIAGPMKGKWQWAGSYPRLFKGVKETPNTGFVDTARIATQKVEEFWDRSLAKMQTE